jgi:ABC-type nitrate/sulfonate/bicarbonate transport system permease component
MEQADMRRINWHGIMFCVAIAAAWELLSTLQIVSPRLFPPLSLILAHLIGLTVSGTLPTVLAETLFRMLAGLIAASVVMVPLGIWAGRSQRLWLIISPTVESLRSLPPALVILPAMLLLGIGSSMKIFAVFFAAAFPILLNTMDGVRAIPPMFIDTARTLRTGNCTMLCEVVVPAATPGIFSGLKSAVPIAFIVAILAEMIGGTDGIGHFLMKSQRSFDIPQMYAATFATAVAGGVLAVTLNCVESACLVWYSGWKRFHDRG